MHVVERYAKWACGWRAQPIASEVSHHARRAVIDWHAALYPGLVVPPATLLKRAFSDETPATAALINGSAAHTAHGTAAGTAAARGSPTAWPSSRSSSCGS